MTILDYMVLSVFLAVFAGLALSTLLEVDRKEIEPIVIEVKEGTATVSKQMIDGDGVVVSGVLPKDSTVKDLPQIDDFDLFEEFLREEGIFEVFFARDLPDYDYGSEEFVSGGFLWNEQSEGQYFWSKHDTTWRKLLVKTKGQQ